jgi:hypothetical protein
MLLSIALANVILYLIMSINVYLETYIFGEFKLGYGVFGPTEARVVLIGMNTLALLWGSFRFDVAGVSVTVFDVGAGATALGMLLLLLTRVGQNLRALARLEPSRRPE